MSRDKTRKMKRYVHNTKISRDEAWTCENRIKPSEWGGIFLTFTAQDKGTRTQHAALQTADAAHTWVHIKTHLIWLLVSRSSWVPVITINSHKRVNFNWGKNSSNTQINSHWTSEEIHTSCLWNSCFIHSYSGPSFFGSIRLNTHTARGELHLKLMSQTVFICHLRAALSGATQMRSRLKKKEIY